MVFLPHSKTKQRPSETTRDHQRDQELGRNVQTGFIEVLTKIADLQESKKEQKTPSQNTKATGSQVKCPKKAF